MLRYKIISEKKASNVYQLPFIQVVLECNNIQQTFNIEEDRYKKNKEEVIDFLLNTYWEI